MSGPGPVTELSLPARQIFSRQTQDWVYFTVYTLFPEYYICDVRYQKVAFLSNWRKISINDNTISHLQNLPDLKSKFKNCFIDGVMVASI